MGRLACCYDIQRIWDDVRVEHHTYHTQGLPYSRCQGTRACASETDVSKESIADLGREYGGMSQLNDTSVVNLAEPRVRAQKVRADVRWLFSTDGPLPHRTPHEID